MRRFRKAGRSVVLALATVGALAACSAATPATTTTPTVPPTAVATPALTASAAPTATATPTATARPTGIVPSTQPQKPTAVPTPTVTDPPVSPERARMLAELAANQAKWNSTRPAAYQYTWANGCFCPPAATGPFTVTVRDGEMLVEAARKGDADPGTYALQHASIEDVFAATRSSIATAAKIQVAYDPQFGFPTSVNVDPIENAVDDEFSLSISDFAAL
jgi:hypothetical protein